MINVRINFVHIILNQLLAYVLTNQKGDFSESFSPITIKTNILTK